MFRIGLITHSWKIHKRGAYLAVGRLALATRELLDQGGELGDSAFHLLDHWGGAEPKLVRAQATRREFEALSAVPRLHIFSSVRLARLHARV
ncbi:hypothetical protein BVG81_009595 [Haliangium sp. UPWRP_2]|nr:hypothetical protein BVG81_009595 [Haliangium sp. UPWRP_2]